MPRQRRNHRRAPPPAPEDLGACLERLRSESGLSWAQLAEMVGTNDHALRRWRAGARPSWRRMLALVDAAERLGLAHVLPIRRARGERRFRPAAEGRGGCARGERSRG